MPSFGAFARDLQALCRRHGVTLAPAGRCHECGDQRRAVACRIRLLPDRHLAARAAAVVDALNDPFHTV